MLQVKAGRSQSDMLPWYLLPINESERGGERTELYLADGVVNHSLSESAVSLKYTILSHSFLLPPFSVYWMEVSGQFHCSKPQGKANLPPLG